MYDWPCFLFANAMTVLTIDFDMAFWSTRSGYNQTILLLFFFFLILFNYAVQGKFITWLVNSALNCTWKPISHSSLGDSCDTSFRVQFNSEFPRQGIFLQILSEANHFTLGREVWVIGYVHEFFFQPLIHTDFFPWGMCLQDIFFPSNIPHEIFFRG